jgi:hypothetical protein
MEHSSHLQLVRESTEDWLNYRDLRPEGEIYTVEVNDGEVYQGLRLSELLQGIEEFVKADGGGKFVISKDGDQGGAPAEASPWPSEDQGQLPRYTEAPQTW